MRASNLLLENGRERCSIAVVFACFCWSSSHLWRLGRRTVWTETWIFSNSGGSHQTTASIAALSDSNWIRNSSSERLMLPRVIGRLPRISGESWSHSWIRRDFWRSCISPSSSSFLNRYWRSACRWLECRWWWKMMSQLQLRSLYRLCHPSVRLSFCICWGLIPFLSDWLESAHLVYYNLWTISVGSTARFPSHCLQWQATVSHISSGRWGHSSCEGFAALAGCWSNLLSLPFEIDLVAVQVLIVVYQYLGISMSSVIWNWSFQWFALLIFSNELWWTLHWK